MRKKRFIAGILLASLMVSSVPATALADSQDAVMAFSVAAESGAEDIAEDMTEGVTGDITGDVAGDAVGDTAGDATGDAAGDATGNAGENLLPGGEQKPGAEVPGVVAPGAESGTASGVTSGAGAGTASGTKKPADQQEKELEHASTDTKSAQAAACAVNIVKQPENVEGGLKATVYFTLEAENVVTYQWYYRKSETSSWYKSGSESGKTDTLGVKISATNVANEYRCKLTDAAGKSIFTDVVKVDLIPGVKVVTQPKSLALKVGAVAHLEVEADYVDEDNAKGYQWQYSKDDGKNWYNSSAAGCNTAVMEFKVTSTSKNNMYRCMMLGIDGNKKASMAAGFVILTKLPVDSKAANGQQATFSLTAEDVTEYQWQYSKDEGKNWYSSGATGAKTDTMTFNVTSTNRKNLYRCKMTKENGVVACSEPVKFVAGPEITGQPENQTAALGETVVYRVDAENIAGYQWQYSKDGTKWYNSSAASAKTSELSVVLSAANLANKYRCKLTGVNGAVIYTAVVYAEEKSAGGEGDGEGGEGGSGTETEVRELEFRNAAGTVLAKAEKVRLGSDDYYADGDVIWVPRAEIEKEAGKLYEYYAVMKDGSRVPLDLNGVISGASGSYAEVRLFFYVPEGISYVIV